MTPHFVVGLVLTGLVGVSLGLLGAGGSIIMLPVLVYVVGVPVREAVPVSLAIVGTTSLLSAMGRSRQGSIRWRSGLVFGSVALVGAYFGSRLTYLVIVGGARAAHRCRRVVDVVRTHADGEHGRKRAWLSWAWFR